MLNAHMLNAAQKSFGGKNIILFHFIIIEKLASKRTNSKISTFILLQYFYSPA